MIISSDSIRGQCQISRPTNSVL